ncbi:MAG: UDP-N-acetylglucosamine 2-epimerase (non-hydrolyzing) [Lacunisphaera sp.]|nr:UDP-N-acetylglucosamine 2-epimerase (non-hydrolyzing) [Lacunisphaera sp.]
MKVITILGTRPEIIRLACVMQRLDAHTDHKIVHTGQNYDFELNEVFFRDLGVRKPDYFLKVDTTSLARVYAGVLIGTEEVLRKEKPDAVLILGDTNSAIAAIIARRMKIPVFHMEAGNRCFDLNVPEETNRRIIDHTADFNLVYTEHARRHLLAEGLPHRRIYLTGSPMREVLEANRAGIAKSDVVAQLKLLAGGFLLASIHREENVDNSANLHSLLAALARAAKEFNVPVIVSTHPRTRKRLDSLGGKIDAKRLRFLKPFGFHDYVKLQMSALCTISDSGTICEESAILGFPAVTVRNAIERPEAVDTGTIVVTGLQPEAIIEGIRLQTSEGMRKVPPQIPAEYAITDTSVRVVKLITGHARLSHGWDGIRGNDLR